MTAAGQPEELAPTPSPQARPDPAGAAAEEVQLLSIDSIVPCDLQPRVNISVDLVQALADSIRSGRHEPVIEVEMLPGADRYQIVCGEQRWRAAREAGRTVVLALVRPPLSHLERLLKQAQENRLRGALDPVEEAHSILQAHTLHSIQRAEALLDEAPVEHPRLEDKRLRDRAGFSQHLAELQDLLIENGVNTMRMADGSVRCRPLSTWRVTERALGISETARKQKVGILRLAPEVLEQVRRLPAEHAIQISRLDDPDLQAELASRAAALTHREVQRVVDEVRKDPALEVDQVLERPAAPAAGRLAFSDQLLQLEELGRQLVRRLRLIPAELDEDQSKQLAATLASLRRHLEWGA
jgi:ParB-like nuclease domain